eukprot:200337-Prymnesium_polylepis.1
MHTYDHPALDDNFVMGVKSLPPTYDEAAYMPFLTNFGTHAVDKLKVGGRWGSQYEFRLHDFTSMMDDSLDIDLAIKYMGKVNAGFSVNSSSATKLISRMESAVASSSSFSTGGTFDTDPVKWTGSVRARPMPIEMGLVPIESLLTEQYLGGAGIANLTQIRATFRTAVERYYC